MNKLIAVIGAGDCSKEIYNQAMEVGKLLAESGYAIICGGLGGVMEGVCKGAKSSNGITVGVIPGDNPDTANQFVDIPIATGMGIGRNIIIIRSALAAIAINGKYGTLSEVSYALQLGKPVIGLNTWDVSDEIIKVHSPNEAVHKVKDLLNNV